MAYIWIARRLSKAIFGRELKTKLPELRGGRSVLDESSRDRDWQHKLEHKEYAESKCGATNSSLAPGDKVLSRNTMESGKLTPNFESTPYTVLTKEGKEVMVQSEDGVPYRRDSSFGKPYHPPTDGTPTADIALEKQEVETRKEETRDARPHPHYQASGVIQRLCHGLAKMNFK